MECRWERYNVDHRLLGIENARIKNIEMRWSIPLRATIDGGHIGAEAKL